MTLPADKPPAASEEQRYATFVALTGTPLPDCIPYLERAFPGDPEARAEVLDMLAETRSEDEIRLLPPALTFAATAGFGYLVRFGRSRRNPA